MTSRSCVSWKNESGLLRRLTGWWASQLIGDVAQVDYDSLDTIALALNLGLQTLHLVAIEGVGDIPTNIDVGHGCGI